VRKEVTRGVGRRVARVEEATALGPPMPAARRPPAAE
jgi:hypothetical protein